MYFHDNMDVFGASLFASFLIGVIGEISWLVFRKKIRGDSKIDRDSNITESKTTDSGPPSYDFSSISTNSMQQDAQPIKSQITRNIGKNFELVQDNLYQDYPKLL